jgi:hypothetical protein
MSSCAVINRAGRRLTKATARSFQIASGATDYSGFPDAGVLVEHGLDLLK